MAQTSDNTDGGMHQTADAPHRRASDGEATASLSMPASLVGADTSGALVDGITTDTPSAPIKTCEACNGKRWLPSTKDFQITFLEKIAKQHEAANERCTHRQEKRSLLHL